MSSNQKSLIEFIENYIIYYGNVAIAHFYVGDIIACDLIACANDTTNISGMAGYFSHMVSIRDFTAPNNVFKIVSESNKKLYDQKYKMTDVARDIGDEFYKNIHPLFIRFVKQGYSPREIALIAFHQVLESEMISVLDLNSK